jgi:GDP-L-fucose synthase
MGSRMAFWKQKRVVVTGGAGFLGSVVVEKIRACGCPNVIVPRSREFNLLERESVVRLLEKARPDIILHLAGVVGGIGENQKYPGRFFYENALMGIQLIEEARRAGVGKLVCVGTVCAYPKLTPIPFREEDLWNGYPEETNAPYGLAKKMLLVQLQSYRQEYGFNGIYLLPVNLYGPGDNFDLETSHVIPALIRKFVEAKSRGERKIVAWGTGNISREFLYVDDAAEGIMLATERLNKTDPMNLGSGQEITIRELVDLVRELSGYDGEIVWDSSQPDGQPRRCLDTSRARTEFGFVASTGLREGLQKTIRWYESQIGKSAPRLGNRISTVRSTTDVLPVSLGRQVSKDPLRRGPADPALGGISLVFPSTTNLSSSSKRCGTTSRSSKAEFRNWK